MIHETKGWDSARNRLIWIVLAAALIVRVVYLLQYHGSPLWDQLTVDNWYHFNWANSIADGNIVGGTTYFRAPFYIYCLGLLFALLGSSLWVARLFGLVVGLASVFMTFKLGERLIDRRTGFVAALLHALYPLAIYYEGELLLDSLFMLLVELTVYSLLRWMDSRRGGDLLGTGLICGLAAITRPTILLIVPLMVLWVLLGVGVRGRIRQTALLVLGLALIIGPVFVRNLRVADDPVLIASQGGINLFIGNNDEADGFSASMPEPMGYNWTIAQVTWQAETETGRELKPGEVSDFWRDRALQWIVDNPGRFLGLFFKKLYFQIGDLDISNNRSLKMVLDTFPLLGKNPLHFAVIFALAVVGIAATWRGYGGVRFVLAFIGLYVLVMSLFFYNSRFRLPLLPFYFVLASAGLWQLKDLISARSRQVAIRLAIAVGAGVLSVSTWWALPYETSPQSSQASGLYAYRHHDFATALEDFREAERVAPDFPEVNLNIGASFFRLGAADSARFYFNREMSHHPGRVKTYQNLGSLDLVQGDYATAVNYARLAVELAPYDITSNILLLRALAADSAEAAGSLAEEAELGEQRTKNDLFYLNEAAAALSRKGDLATAELLSQAAVKAVPPPVETDPLAFGPDYRNAGAPFDREKARSWHLLGYIAGVEGDFDRAVDCAREAVKLDPRFEEGYVNLISALRISGKASEADSVLTIAEERFPHSETIRSLRTQTSP